MIHLTSQFMRNLLRDRSPAVYFASLLIPRREQDGLHALATFVHVCRDVVENADSSMAAKMSASSIEQMIAHGETNKSILDQPILDRVIDDNPDLGLAWESWCAIEEEFGVPRRYAAEFAEGLQMDVQAPRFETSEELLAYCYHTGGVLGLMACHILQLNPSLHQGVVDAASSARLATLANNIYRDFSKGRIYVPATWISLSTTRIFSKSWALEAAKLFKRHADILSRSAEEITGRLPFRLRLALSVAAVSHRESRSSLARKTDRIFDQFVRQSAAAIWSYLKRQPPLPTVHGASLTTRDPGYTLRSQEMRLSRDLSQLA